VTSGVNTRELALDCLIEVMEKDRYSHLVLRGVLDKYAYLEKQERAFLTRLVEGTIERTVELDYILNIYSGVKVKKMKPFIRNLLRMSVYQLRHMDSVPDSAVCNEAVKLAKKRGFSKLSGFVNGVLRNIVRNPERIVFPDREKDITASLSVEYSMPEWIVKQWISAFGEEKTECILQAFSKEYRLSIRTNLNRTTPEKLADALRAQGMDVRISERLPYALEVSGYDRLSAIQQFLAGDFYVQDVSSMMVAEWANVKAGDTVIDVCAAPGGKSTHIAELLKGTGHVTARDLTEEKVALIRENISRHGLSNMEAEVRDATIFDENSREKADVLICDLPCSGLGVLGRKTDIRYKMTPEKQEELVKLQRQILNTVFAYVRQGGTLLYSTCTIHRGENEENVEWFLKEHPEFELEEMQQLLPGETGQDGFFLAKMKRK
jgi:16S rRNA (cytosine967-C5)-methyltransferase